VIYDACQWRVLALCFYFNKHASKILFLIMLEKITVKTETEIADEKAGFRQKRTKRPNQKSQNTDAQGTRAPATTLYVLCGIQEGI